MRRAHAVAVIGALLCGAALVGCREGAEDAAPVASGRGVPQTPSAEALAAQPTPPPSARGWQDPMLARPHEERPAMAHVDLPPLTETVTTPGAPIPAPVPRDLAGELKAIAGDVLGCVPAAERAALPERVTLDLEAVVTNSGVVSRADVRSGDVSASAAVCLRTRIGAARFGAPVPDAPRSVTAHVVLDRRQAPAPAP